MSFGQIFAQPCIQATVVQLQTPFTFMEDNGEAWASFQATSTKMAIGFAWTPGNTLPDSMYFYSGNCTSMLALDALAFIDDPEQMIYYEKTNLVVGNQYLVALKGIAGSAFEVNGMLSAFNVQPPNTCPSNLTCNLVQNPGFEDIDPSTVLPVGGSYPPPTALGSALINEACGWERASLHLNCTPDFYLAPISSTYFVKPPCTAFADGNVCSSLGHTGNGNAQLFTLDQTNNPNANDRREYIYSNLQIALNPNANYLFRMAARSNLDRGALCSSIQILFPNGTYIPVAHNNVIPNWGTPQLNFAADIDETSANWQQLREVFKYTGPGSNSIVVGNFHDDAQSNPHFTNNPNAPNNIQLAALFVDDFELYELANAGEDATLCQLGDYQLGYDPQCPLPYAVNYQWIDVTNPASPVVIGTNATQAVTYTQSGTYEYQLRIVVDGITFFDDVTIYVAPVITATTVVNSNCDPNKPNGLYFLNSLPPSTSFNAPVFTGISATVTMNPTSGQIELIAPIFNPGAAYGTVTISGFFFLNGVQCNFSIDLNYYLCCQNINQVDYYLPNGSSFTAILPAGTGLGNQSFLIDGSVSIDDHYNFTNCTFYMMPDAQLVIDPNFQVFMEECEIKPCNDFMYDRLLIEEAAELTFTSSTMSGAIRGIHVLNNASLKSEFSLFQNNYNAIFIDNHLNANFLEIYGSTFNCNYKGINGVNQAMGSPVPFAIPTHTNITGISMLNSEPIQIGESTQTENLFTTSSPGSQEVKYELSYIHVVNSVVTIQNNLFGLARAGILAKEKSDLTIGGSGTNQANTFNSVVYSAPGATPYTDGIGIEAYQSFGLVLGNTFAKLNKAVHFQDCGPLAPVALGYQRTHLKENNIDATHGITFTVSPNQAPTGSRIRIIDNLINAKESGIWVNGYTECDVPGHGTFISGNTLELDLPSGQNDKRQGIVVENCHCPYIDGNSLEIDAYLPVSSPKADVIGCYIKGGINAQLSNNTISQFDYGLIMDDESGTTQYSCIDFTNNYTPIVYRNIDATVGANRVKDVNDFNSGAPGSAASAQVSFTTPFGPYKVEVSNCLVGTLANWYYDGAGNDPDPTSSGTYFNLFSLPIPSSPLTNGCNPLPAAKNNQQPNDKKLAVSIYPNPNPDGYVTIKLNRYAENIKIALFDIHERLMALNKAYGEEVNLQYKVANGMYVMIIEADGERFYEKLVISQ